MHGTSGLGLDEVPLCLVPSAFIDVCQNLVGLVYDVVVEHPRADSNQEIAVVPAFMLNDISTESRTGQSEM